MGNQALYLVAAIIVAIVVAVGIPQLVAKEQAIAIFEAIGIGGEVFLRALTMVVVPLVMASVMSGILGLGDVRKLGRPGLVAVSYYVATTMLAVIVGVLVVTLIKPGAKASLDEKATTMITSEDRQQVLETFADESGLQKEKVAKIFPQLGTDEKPAEDK
ncbi:MAG: dicarboxylate/amino acid:cation symporter, partial [Planctomycetaceae bacterium]|nr:dicarboxylate/amino acid:cation symporter [Planctomycetaceae bacterium]